MANERKARYLFLREYGGGMNLLTPSVWEYGMIRGRLAYELSYGEGMFDNRYMFGITILLLNDDGTVTRGDTAGAGINKCLSGNSLPYLAQDARAYLNEVAKEWGI